MRPRYTLFALLFASLVACGMVVMRMVMTLLPTYAMMIPNLLLAWIPYLCSLMMLALFRRHPKQWWWQLTGLGVVWLLFFPNSAYLATEFVHLGFSRHFPYWYDMCLVLAFAWTGCFLAVASLHGVASIVTALAGRGVTTLFIVLIAFLNGVGIWLGRFLRWNSWDVFLAPQSILSDVIAPLLAPTEHPQAIGVTLFFAAFMLVCYLSFTSFSHEPALESSQ